MQSCILLTIFCHFVFQEALKRQSDFKINVGGGSLIKMQSNVI